ncbi:MAG: B12-binding domain-containing protein [Ignavibacteria bacterium]|nr:B12-binding domain-containing protein [Ignavibacteria bacterium]
MDKKLKCIYDPLEELIEYFKNKGISEDFVSHERETTLSPIDKILINQIVEGNKTNLEKNLTNALKIYSPLEIINDILLTGMKIVGELFGSGKMQLPFVLQSAECMKFAVEFLEQFIDKNQEPIYKGTLILATVKGDVHDIGKNLVDIILTNNGYRVINLGIKCPLEKMIDAYLEYKADAIGMSGLLVKSTLVMKENLEILNKRNLSVPVILGGAALTKRYVESELQNLYNGLVFYAKDAFDGLRYMSEIKELNRNIINNDYKQSIYKKTTVENNTYFPRKIINSTAKKEEIIEQRLKVEYKIPKPPFWGCRILSNINVEEIFEYIDQKVLFAGRWNYYKRKDISEEEHKNIIENIAKPKFNELKSFILKENLFIPKAIYGYYPCQSDGDDLIIYKPIALNENELFSSWQIKNSSISLFKLHELVEWKRIKFTRQKSGEYLCLSDFFKPKNTDVIDVIPMQIVTIGDLASKYAKEFYNQNKFSEYLYFHGLAVEYTEALAEYIHTLIIKELKIETIEKIISRFPKKYSYLGKRYSFGYPSCPELENTKILFEILRPERIGIELTEQFQMIPEESTNALIVYREDARYFSVN